MNLLEGYIMQEVGVHVCVGPLLLIFCRICFKAVG